MPIQILEFKVPIFVGKNATPIAPVSAKAGNGSHFIDLYNRLIDTLEPTINAVEEELTNLTNQVSQIPSTSIVYPSFFTHWHDTSIKLDGANLQTFIFSDQPYNTIAKQEPSVLNDSFKFVTPLKSGYFKLFIMARTALDGGMFEIYLNDVLITPTPIDLYSGTPAPINILINFEFPSQGEAVFFIKCANTSQTGYALPFTKFVVRIQ